MICPNCHHEFNAGSLMGAAKSKAKAAAAKKNGAAPVKEGAKPRGWPKGKARGKKSHPQL
jgi:hypothetical protein